MAHLRLTYEEGMGKRGLKGGVLVVGCLFGGGVDISNVFSRRGQYLLLCQHNQLQGEIVEVFGRPYF